MKSLSLKDIALKLLKKSNGFTDRDRGNWIDGACHREMEINALKYRMSQMYTSDAVEEISIEMVNWTLDNMGNPNANSGKKFDEVAASHKGLTPGSVEIKYSLVTDLFGDRPNGRDPQIFKSVEEATKHWEEHYKNRNKGDGHDEYWRKTPLRILETVTTRLWEN